MVRRRTVFGIAASVVAAGVGVIEIKREDSQGTPAQPSPHEDTSGRPRAVVRFAFDGSTAGWRSTTGQATLTSSGRWLVVAGSGAITVSSPESAPPANWSLPDRENANRLTATVSIDGPADEYPVRVLMRWQGDDGVQEASSVPFAVPTGVPVDLDTWWDCRETAPADVLRRVKSVALAMDAGGDDIVLRLRDVRQPPSTRTWGLPATGLATVFARVGEKRPSLGASDAYQRSVLQKLNTAHQWALTNNRGIHIGEWGWPKEVAGDPAGGSTSDQEYAVMADRWMDLADRLAIPYTPWGESAYWAGSDVDGDINYGSYPLANYFCGEGYDDPGAIRTISERKPSAAVLERHHNRVAGVPPSINVVGMCFTFLKDGTQYSASNIGSFGHDYFAENPYSIAYLHARGYRIFRLSFRWDRVMRTPDADELDPVEWGHVDDAINAILALPDTAVIVDVHCSGEFWISPSPDDRSVEAVRHVVDGPTGVVTTKMFVDFWLLLSRALRNRSTRLIYEITNEPHDTSPLLVKRYTQAVVAALRAAKDGTFCLIPSYPYDNITTAFAEENQPFPWIDDPVGTRWHAYTLHQYMDYDQSGSYALSYDETLSMETS